MKMFLIAALAIAAVSAVPTNRNECPTLEEIGNAFEDHFGVAVYIFYQLCYILIYCLSHFKIPDEFLDCLNGGDNCPFDSFEDFEGWFESNTGLEVQGV